MIMKRIWMIALLALMLTGCKTIQEIKPDTIVDIPLHPTQPVTEAGETAAQEATEGTVAPPETELPTETEPAAQTQDSGKPSGGRKPDQEPAGTLPPATQPPTVPPSCDPGGYTPGSLDRAAAEAVNARRQAAELPPLRLDAGLCGLASVRAREIAVLWSNTRPGGGAGTSVLDEYGYGYAAAAENLYFGTGTAEDIVGKWMQADTTKARILMEASAIGVGSYTAPDGLTYVAALIVG